VVPLGPKAGRFISVGDITAGCQLLKSFVRRCVITLAVSSSL